MKGIFFYQKKTTITEIFTNYSKIQQWAVPNNDSVWFLYLKARYGLTKIILLKCGKVLLRDTVTRYRISGSNCVTHNLCLNLYRQQPIYYCTQEMTINRVGSCSDNMTHYLYEIGSKASPENQVSCNLKQNTHVSQNKTIKVLV